MKIFISTLLIFFIATSAHSQVEFGIFGGPQATSATYKIDETKQKTSYKFGFQVGGMMKVPFEGNLYFAPAAFYSMKGYKVSFNKISIPPDIDAVDNNTTFHNLELAGLLQYDFGANPDHFFLKAGPSLELQLLGNEKFNRSNDVPVDRKIKFGFADYGHYLFNFLTILGYESSNGFTIYGQYSLGLANIINTDGGPTVRHQAFGISFGKYFNRKKIIIDTRNIE
ncbi:MAG: porin family protein [Chitinophagaceae bacterium]